ncbi:MAG: hypothetical protein QOJ59_5366 [Thermomicrobiales bacterium]|nr:hypothetical protein [Thermomicrobiales bacterium]
MIRAIKEFNRPFLVSSVANDSVLAGPLGRLGSHRAGRRDGGAVRLGIRRLHRIQLIAGLDRGRSAWS